MLHQHACPSLFYFCYQVIPHNLCVVEGGRDSPNFREKEGEAQKSMTTRFLRGLKGGVIPLLPAPTAGKRRLPVPEVPLAPTFLWVLLFLMERATCTTVVHGMGFTCSHQPSVPRFSEFLPKSWTSAFLLCLQVLGKKQGLLGNVVHSCEPPL